MNVMAREHAIEHVGPPQETPVTAAMRYGHGLIRKNTWQNTGWRTTLWQYSSSMNAKQIFIETPIALVERRRRYQNSSIYP